MKLISVPRTNPKRNLNSTSIERILKNKTTHRIEVTNNDSSNDENIIFVESSKFLLDKCIFLGGDASITFPIVRALLTKNKPDDIFIISLDAHANVTPCSITPTREEAFYAILKETDLPRENIAFIGLRNTLREENHFLNYENISHFYASEKTQEIMQEIINLAKHKKVYLSIDLSVFDKKNSPGVIYSERNGPKKEELFNIIKELYYNLDIVATDIVELDLKNDSWRKTRKLVNELVDFIIQQNTTEQLTEIKL